MPARVIQGVYRQVKVSNELHAASSDQPDLSCAVSSISLPAAKTSLSSPKSSSTQPCTKKIPVYVGLCCDVVLSSMVAVLHR